MANRNRGREKKEKEEASRADAKPGAAVNRESGSNLIGFCSGVIRKHSVSIILFLFSLFFVITFSAPAVYINDEWISANQLHQLDIGHQITVNEGKYGVYLNGTPGPYFQNLNNMLTYSMMLPVLALPVIKVFGLFGDSFRLAVIMLWASIPLVIALLIDTCYPRYASIRGIRVTFCAILLSFGLLLLDLLLYRPFIYIAPDAPVEVAALMFTNHLLFASLVVIVYHICRILFEDRWKSLLGTFLCIACSSYIFWGTTAKDHMLTATIFALVIFFIICYLRTGSWNHAALGFLCCGLLAWVRPEVGCTVAIVAGLFMAGDQVFRIRARRTDLPGAVRIMLSACFVLIGAIPLFINNLITTGKLLVPLEFSHTAAVVSPVSSVSSGTVSVAPDIVSSLGDLVYQMSWNYNIAWNSLLSDISGFVLYPQTGGLGFLLVCPLAFLAGVLFVYALWKKQEIPARDRMVLVFLAVMTIAIVLAYVKNFHTMAADHAIIPDIRYLSPAYLPAGLLGVYMLYLNGFPPRADKCLSRLVLCGAVMVPLIIIGIIAFPPIDEKFGGYPVFFSYAITLVTVLFTAGLLVPSVKKRHAALLAGCFILLVALLLSWQMLMDIMFCMTKFTGYPFWIPATDTVFNKVFVVHMLE